MFYSQAELFGAPTQKKEATPNLRMVAYLEKEASMLICHFIVTNSATVDEVYFWWSSR